MGYETTMLIVEGKEKKGKPVGYHSVIASVELSCCGHDGPMGQLIGSHKDGDKQLHQEIADMEAEHKKCFNAEGDYTEELKGLSKEQKDKAVKKYYSLRRKIEAKLPYIYWHGGNNGEFTDSYGSLLIIATVKEVYEAIVRDQAQIIAKKEYEGVNGYRRFHLALKTLEGFIQNNGAWSEVKVVLYGH